MLSHWARSSPEPTLAQPASLSDLAEASNRLGSPLPSPLVALLGKCNGFVPPHDQDAGGFSFWSADRLRWWQDRDRAQLVFCDYLAECWFYALDVDSGAVVLVGTESGQPQVVARDFFTFLDLYMTDSAALYPAP
ncbi:MAG: SMI1/KNR4 family protein [Planctomycetes bacterium]|nr:SMI1/KNR4 family protein [Planctomycetota bacterium]